MMVSIQTLQKASVEFFTLHCLKVTVYMCVTNANNFINDFTGFGHEKQCLKIFTLLPSHSI